MLQWWDEAGYLKPSLRAGRDRVYSREDLDRAKKITQLRAVFKGRLKSRAFRTALTFPGVIRVIKEATVVEGVLVIPVEAKVKYSGTMVPLAHSKTQSRKAK
jgi:hypothetical protein